MVLSPLQLAASSLHTLEAPLVKELGGVFLEDVLVLCSALPFIPVSLPCRNPLDHWPMDPVANYNSANKPIPTVVQLQTSSLHSYQGLVEQAKLPLLRAASMGTGNCMM